MLWRLAAAVVLCLGAGPATAEDSEAEHEPLADAPARRVLMPDGRRVFTVEPAAGEGQRQDLRAPDGRRLGTVGPIGRGKERLEVRGTDGRRIAELRRSRLTDKRVEQLDDRGRPTGHWERSPVSGDWHLYGPDGRWKAVAKRPR